MKRALLNVDENGHLLCPNCGVNYLHIYTASISMGRVSVSAHGDSIVVPADSMDGNAAPQSDRGSSVEVIFLCEAGCQRLTAVGFSFHKGNVRAGTHVLDEPEEVKQLSPDEENPLFKRCLWRS